MKSTDDESFEELSLPPPRRVVRPNAPTPAVPAVAVPAPTAATPKAASPRKRKPRQLSASSQLVAKLETKLKEARILGKALEIIADLSPWGCDQAEAAIKVRRVAVNEDNA